MADGAYPEFDPYPSDLDMACEGRYGLSKLLIPLPDFGPARCSASTADGSVAASHQTRLLTVAPQTDVFTRNACVNVVLSLIHI